MIDRLRERADGDICLRISTAVLICLVADSGKKKVHRDYRCLLWWLTSSIHIVKSSRLVTEIKTCNFYFADFLLLFIYFLRCLFLRREVLLQKWGSVSRDVVVLFVYSQSNCNHNGLCSHEAADADIVQLLPHCACLYTFALFFFFDKNVSTVTRNNICCPIKRVRSLFLDSVGVQISEHVGLRGSLIASVTKHIVHATFENPASWLIQNLWINAMSRHLEAICQNAANRWCRTL